MNRHEFTRTTFAAPRIAEFAELAGLEKQTGHRKEQWAQVVAKELIDNALDAAESVGIAPVIDVAVDTRKGTITVKDNGRFARCSKPTTADSMSRPTTVRRCFSLI